jgi:K+-transporting ATPase A subunit
VPLGGQHEIDVVSLGSRVNGSKTAVPAAIVLVIFTVFVCGVALATGGIQ